MYKHDRVPKLSSLTAWWYGSQKPASRIASLVMSRLKKKTFSMIGILQNQIISFHHWAISNNSLKTTWTSLRNSKDTLKDWYVCAAVCISWFQENLEFQHTLYLYGNIFGHLCYLSLIQTVLQDIHANNCPRIETFRITQSYIYDKMVRSFFQGHVQQGKSQKTTTIPAKMLGPPIPNVI